ncbi:hypothetical protein [Streptomyces abikoensis]
MLLRSAPNASRLPTSAAVDPDPAEARTSASATLCSTLDGGQDVLAIPAQRKARHEYENRVNNLDQ